MKEIMDLYSKPASYKFNEQELQLIREHLKINEYRCKYAFYKKVSTKGCQIAFIIDSYYKSPRKSGVENNWDVVIERPICNIEFEEIVQNFGTNKRRFSVFYYKTIEHLIAEDKLYGIDTPQMFVEECVARGYSEKKIIR